MMSGVPSGVGNADSVTPPLRPGGSADPGIEAPEITLQIGQEHYLRKHSWAVYRQDGMMDIGIEDSFLKAIDGPVVDVEIPGAGDLVEQGYIAIRLKTKSGEVHGVFMPLSGQVVGVHREALEDPSSIGGDTWLVQVLPNRLETEIRLLLRS